MNLKKKEMENGMDNSRDKEQLDYSRMYEKTPEFNVIGTALNDV